MDADTFVALLALLILAVGASVLAAPAVASHDDPANFTVGPQQAPADRSPNVTDASFDTWVEVREPYQDVLEVQYRIPYDGFETCREENLQTFGIDRGGDDPGTTTDDEPDPTQVIFDGSYFIYNVNGSFDLARGDELVASVTDCIDTPAEEGWYQGQFFLYDQDDVQLQSTSHYYWHCECENESEARERLGPPPSETTSTPTATSTPGTASTATSSPTATDAPTATATDAPTATATTSPDGTQTPGDGDGPSSTPTAEPGPTPTDESAVVTAEEGGSFAQGDGPGLGLIAALVALLASGVLARRR